jgi:hypothetical protein
VQLFARLLFSKPETFGTVEKCSVNTAPIYMKAFIEETWGVGGNQMGRSPERQPFR